MSNIVRGKDDPVSAFNKLMDRHKGALEKALAKHLPAERLIRVASNALHRNPALQNCTMPSIINSVVLCGVMGLEPNTPLQHAYLIPYGKECTFQPGYRGLMAIARRTAGVKRWRAEIVCPEDQYEIEFGMNERLIHRLGDNREENNWVRAYSFLLDESGDPYFIDMSRKQVLDVRDKYSIAWQQKPDNSPWRKAEGEMVKKTVIKRHCKTLDLSIEIATASAMDDQAETEGKQESFIEAEFRELSEQAEDAQSALGSGSYAEQERIAEEKIKAMSQEERDDLELKAQLVREEEQRIKTTRFAGFGKGKS